MSAQDVYTLFVVGVLAALVLPLIGGRYGGK